MRIIAGNLSGRQFDAPKTHRTHPMSERMRGALFNSLGDIKGLSVLDAYSGSGAFCFEALSRGAKTCQSIEINVVAYKAIVKNCIQLGLADLVKVTRANISSWLDGNPNQKFDLVLCDPPFDNLKMNIIQKIPKAVHRDGLMVLSWPAKQRAPEITGVELNFFKEKSYGDAQLVFYRKTG